MSRGVHAAAMAAAAIAAGTLACAAVACALAPLTAMPALRELLLLRGSSDCGLLVGGDGEGDRMLPQFIIAQALHPLRVRVLEAPRQAVGTVAPVWELEDAAGVLPEAALCRGLAPVHHAGQSEEWDNG